MLNSIYPPRGKDTQKHIIIMCYIRKYQLPMTPGRHCLNLPSGGKVLAIKPLKQLIHNHESVNIWILNDESNTETEKFNLYVMATGLRNHRINLDQIIFHETVNLMDDTYILHYFLEKL